MHFDGRIDSVGPALHNVSAEIYRLKNEINSLHQFLDRLGVDKYGINGEMNLGERFEKLLQSPGWTEIESTSNRTST